MKHVFKMLGVMLLLAAFALGQTSTTSTTLSAAISRATKSSA
jgi:hypothetical protein